MTEEQIEQHYRNSLEVPEQNIEKLFMICPVGVVGAGKTTVLKKLSEKLGLVRISSDEIRKLLKENGYGYDNVKDIAFRINKHYLAKGHSIAIDGDCYSKKERNNIQQLHENTGASPIWIHIDPPEEFIINKLTNYKHTWLFKDSKQAVQNYLSSKERHSDTSDIDFIYVFDTSKEDLDKQVEDCLELIEQTLS